jgi:hypothetical protein
LFEPLRKLSLLFLFLLTLVLLPDACRANESFHFTQQSKLAGPYDLYVSDDAIKAVNRKTGFALYSRAPGWQVLICNPARKVYCTLPSEQFTGKLAHTISLIDPATMEHLQYRPGKKETFLGLRVVHSQASIKESEFRSNLDPSKSRVWTGDCIEFEDKLVPIPIWHALQRLYGLPLRNNLPLRVSYHDVGNTVTVALDTSACKRGKFDMNYSVPDNFKKVSTEMEVCAPAGKSELDFLLR